MKFRVLDLFAGAGGFSLGFDLVRAPDGSKAYEIVLAVDYDEAANKTLRKYFQREYEKPDIALLGDLTQNDTHEKILQKCSSGVDLIMGGPPCQSFSLIGPRSGYGRTSDREYHCTAGLYREYLRLVRELRPSFIVFENVKGIISKRDTKKRRYIDVIAEDFKELGYSFESENPDLKGDYMILNAADYGVPQTRERVFLIGNNLGIKNPFPQPTHEEKQYITLREAIGDLPRLRAKMTYTDVRKEDRPNVDRRNAQVFSGADEVPYHHELFRAHWNSSGEKGRGFLEFIQVDGHPFLTHHLSRRQKRDDILLFRSMLPGMTARDIFRNSSNRATRLRELVKYDMTSFLDKYKKQRWGKPCSTVFAHLEKDGNRFIHPDGKQARTLTPREAARIQSFPDWYEFEGSFKAKFRQIGNAVPPILAKVMGGAICSKMCQATSQSQTHAESRFQATS